MINLEEGEESEVQAKRSTRTSGIENYIECLLLILYIGLFAYAISIIVICSIIIHNKHLDFEKNSYNTALIVMSLISGCFLLLNILSAPFRENESSKHSDAITLEGALSLAIVIMALVKVETLWSTTYGLIFVILMAIFPLSLVALTVAALIVYWLTICFCG
jgi:cytochrome bd-type quinol oxidase subunit 2